MGASGDGRAVADDHRALRGGPGGSDADVLARPDVGGLTALRLAVTAPELVRKLVIVDVTPSAPQRHTEMTDEQKGTVALVQGEKTFPSFDAMLEVPIGDLIFGEKTVIGSLYGSAQVMRDFPRLVRLVESGQLDLDAMVSSTLSLGQVNDGFRAMEAGEVIRSVITY